MKSLIYSAIFGVALLTISCDKKEIVAGPNPAIEPTQTTELAELQQQYIQDKTQSFTVDANTATTLTGTLGTQIILSGSNFTDQNGNPLVGNVDISLVEIYSPVDMILMNKTTVGLNNGVQGMLTSGGEFSIDVSQNGNPVKINNDIQIITAPTNFADPSMSLFGADANSAGDVLWNPIAAPLLPDTAAFGYIFDADTNYQWINCDYFWSATGNQTGVSLDLPTGHNNANTKVFAAFPSENAAANLDYISGSLFGTNSSYSLPVGLNVTYVVLSTKDGQLQYALETTTIAPNFAITNFNPASDLDAIKLAIEPFL